MKRKILYLGLDPTHYQADGELVHWPIIQIIPRPPSDQAIINALRQFDRYTHIVVTSKTTIGILHSLLSHFKVDIEIWKQKVTIVVGRATAKRLIESGIFPAFVSKEETAEGIIEVFKQLNLKEAHLFWPHSAYSRPIIRDFLDAEKILYSECVLYEPAPCIAKNIPKIADFDEIVFTSPSTVEAFLRLFGRLPNNIKLTPIGPVTAAALNQTYTHRDSKADFRLGQSPGVERS